MILTDTHTHIYYETDPERRRQLIERSFENDVSRLFLPNVDSGSVALIRTLSQEYPKNCFPMLGLHPCDVTEGYQAELEKIGRELETLKIYAVGEIGIDMYHDQSKLLVQTEAFRQQIRWAKQLNLPIVIHCREAFDEVFRVLEEEKDEMLRGIFHCFTGTIEQAQQIIDLGFFLGIGGVVTFKKSGLDKVVADISLEHIVLETDSPYLAPTPFRGKPNESSYLVYVAAKVAEVKNMTIEEVAQTTTNNSKKIFGI